MPITQYLGVCCTNRKNTFRPKKPAGAHNGHKKKGHPNSDMGYRSPYEPDVITSKKKKAG